MTDQQKYAELLVRHQELGFQIDRIAEERSELCDQMKVIDGTFPDSFYYRLDTSLLFRADKLYPIELREFD